MGAALSFQPRGLSSRHQRQCPHNTRSHICSFGPISAACCSVCVIRAGAQTDADGLTAAAAKKQGFKMLIRQLTAASLLSLAVISLPASTQTAKAAAPLALCKADAERICSGVAPGGGKLIACLKLHKEEVSVGCAKALKALKTKKGT